MEQEQERKKPDMVINRVPAKTLMRFWQFAEQEYANDWGMAVKGLMDFYDGLIPTGTEHLELQIQELTQRVETLEAASKPHEQTKAIRMADGTQRLI